MSAHFSRECRPDTRVLQLLCIDLKANLAQ